MKGKESHMNIRQLWAGLWFIVLGLIAGYQLTHHNMLLAQLYAMSSIFFLVLTIISSRHK